MSFFDNEEEGVDPFELIRKRKADQEAAKTPAPTPAPTGDFLSQYKAAASDRSSIEKARGDADRANKITGVLQGLGIAFGGGNRNAGVFDGIRAQNNAKAKTVESDYQAKLDNLLTQDKIGYQATERDRAGKTFDMAVDKNARETQEFNQDKNPDSPAAKSLSLLLQSKGMKPQMLNGMSFDQMKDIYKQVTAGDGAGGGKWSIQNVQAPDGSVKLYRVSLTDGSAIPVQIDNASFAAAAGKGYAPKIFNDKGTGESKMVSADVSNPVQTVLSASTPLDPNKKDPSSFDLRSSLNPKQREQVDAVQKQYSADTKTLMSRKEAANSVKELIGAARNGNPMSKEGFGSMMARLNSEVGALSEADKAPFGGAAGWAAALNRLQDLQFWDGEMTEQDLKFLETTVGALERGVDSSLQRYQERAAQTIQDQTGLDPKYSSQLLNPVQQSAATAVQQDAGSERLIEAVKAKNPNASREQIVNALIQKGKIKQGYK